MTRGHAILCLLYIKMRRNVKKYFGSGKRYVSGMQADPARRVPSHFPTGSEGVRDDGRVMKNRRFQPELVDGQ
jgi:hypothetical protein